MNILYSGDILDSKMSNIVKEEEEKEGMIKQDQILRLNMFQNHSLEDITMRNHVAGVPLPVKGPSE